MSVEGAAIGGAEKGAQNPAAAVDAARAELLYSFSSASYVELACFVPA